MQDILFSQALASEANGYLEKSQIRIITAALFFAFSIVRHSARSKSGVLISSFES